MSELQELKSSIQLKGLQIIENYFNLSNEELERTNPEVLKHLLQRAKMGLNFEKELNLMQRASENNFLRVFKLIAEDKEEIRKLIRTSLPQYLPN